MATETTRANIAALIDQQQQAEIWEEATKQSFALKHFTKKPMTSNQMRLRQLLALPSHSNGFVNGDTGRKQTLSLEYENVLMNAEEIAGIFVFNEASLEDSSFDLLGEAKKYAAQVIAVNLDNAVLSGVGAPASWPDSIAEGAAAAGQVVDLASYPGTAGDGTDDLASAYSALLAVIENKDLTPDVVLARPNQRAAMRNLRNANGDLIYASNLQGATTAQAVWGVPVDYVDNGTLGAAGDGSVAALTGDFSKAVLGIRTGVEFKLMTEGVITKDTVITNGTDPDQTIKEVLYSLGEQDMLALRFRVRVGFAVMRPTSLVGGTNPYPFARLNNAA